MRTRRFLIALSTVGLLLGFGTVGASPASAADLGVFNGCIPGNIKWSNGDTVTVVIDDSECSAVTGGMSPPQIGTTTVNGDTCWFLTNTGTDDFNVTVNGQPTVVVSNFVASTTAVPTVCGDPAIATGSSPDPWLQSYGRSAGGTCRAGWHPSWAEWAVDKTGGWVCNRTVFWNGSTWLQNPNEAWGSANPADNSAWDGK